MSPRPGACLGACLRASHELLASLVASTLSVLLLCPALPEAGRERLFNRATRIYEAGDIEGTLFLVGRSLAGESGSRSLLLAWPGGVDLTQDFPNRAFTDLLAALVPSLGLPLAFNGLALCVLVLDGLSVHLFARVLGARAMPALLAGALAASASILVEEIVDGRPVTALWALALAGVALCLASLRSWPLLGLLPVGLLLLALALANYGYHVVLLLPVAAGAALCLLPRLGRAGLLRAALGLLAALSVLVPVGRMISGQRAPLPATAPFLAGQAWSLLALLGEPVKVAPLLVLPLALLPMLGVLAVFSWRKALSWAPLALGVGMLLLLSLGPNLAGHAGRLDPGMPFVQVLSRVPLLYECPRPTRYGMAAALGLHVLLGLLASQASAGWRRTPRAALLTLVFGAVALDARVALRGDALLPWPPLGATDLMRGETVLLDLPLRFPSPRATYALAGVVPVPRLQPPEAGYERWVGALSAERTPLLLAAAVVQAGHRPSDALLERLRAPLPESEAWGLRRVVLHTRVPAPEALAAWRALLGNASFEVLGEEAGVEVWQRASGP